MVLVHEPGTRFRRSTVPLPLKNRSKVPQILQETQKLRFLQWLDHAVAPVILRNLSARHAEYLYGGLGYDLQEC